MTWAQNPQTNSHGSPPAPDVPRRAEPPDSWGEQLGCVGSYTWVVDAWMLGGLPKWAKYGGLWCLLKSVYADTTRPGGPIRDYWGLLGLFRVPRFLWGGSFGTQSRLHKV